MFNVLKNEPPVKAYIGYWNNALNFKHDYATRPDFWWVFIANFLLFFLLSINIYWEIVYTILTIIPSLSLISRRYHDVGLSGWLQIIAPLDVLIAIWPSRKGATYHRIHHQQV